MVDLWWVPGGLVLVLVKGCRSVCNSILPFILAWTLLSLAAYCEYAHAKVKTLLQFLSGCYGHTEEVTDLMKTTCSPLACCSLALSLCLGVLLLFLCKGPWVLVRPVELGVGCSI